MENSDPRKVVIITGPNQGMGLGYVQHYVTQPETFVVATCRKPQDSQELKDLATENSNMAVLALDISTDESVAAFKVEYDALKLPPFDLLILNAGVFWFEIRHFENNSSELLNKMYNINAVGNYRVFNALKDRIRTGARKSRVVFVSSKHGLFSKDLNIFLGCKMSRAANNMLAKVVANDFDLHAIAVHPGLVRTKLANFKGELEVHEVIPMLVKLYDEIDESKNGKFFWYDGTQKDY